MGVTAAVLAVAATAYTVSESEKTKAEAKKNLKKQQAEADDLLFEAAQKEKKTKITNDTTLSQQRLRANQKQKALAKSGSSSTLLTSPLGLPGDAPSANKTLLGS